MNSIIFVTGNPRKIKEAMSTLTPFSIEVQCQDAEFHKIQHYDPTEIAKAKVGGAFAIINQPVVVQDTSWSIPALGGFPGGYMKDVANWWSPEDWLQLMSRHRNKTIYCHEHVAYFDGKILQHFESTYKGFFVDTPRGIGENSIEKVVCLYRGQTLAEVHDQQGIAPAGEVLEHWRQFGEWFRSLTK